MCDVCVYCVYMCNVCMCVNFLYAVFIHKEEMRVNVFEDLRQSQVSAVDVDSVWILRVHFYGHLCMHL